MDQDLWSRAVFFHGSELLNSIVNDSSNDFPKDSKRQKIFNFIKNHHNTLFQERPPVYNQPPGFTPMPVELFWDCPIEQRRKLFFKNLERGDILILKVVNDSLQDNYKLLVLAKHRCCMKLDDLNLVMYLPKLKEELDLAGGGLDSYDVIRAAVCSCSINERKLFVTLSSSILEEGVESVKLGKINIDELPLYVGDIQLQHSSYKSYYHQTLAFRDPNWSNQLYDVLGFKRNYYYSFHKEWDGKKYPVSECGEAVKKKHDIMISKSYYDKAVEHYENNNLACAIANLDQALAYHPENKRALVSRGTLYANSNNLRKAFFDTEQALKIDPLFEPAQKQMSVLLVAAAKAHLQKSDITAAQESLNAALGLDERNEEAQKLLVDLEKGDLPILETTVTSSPGSEISTKSKKKSKKKHRKRNHEKDEKKKHRQRSRSRSPKKKKTMSSVVNVVGNF